MFEYKYGNCTNFLEGLEKHFWLTQEYMYASNTSICCTFVWCLRCASDSTSPAITSEDNWICEGSGFSDCEVNLLSPVSTTNIGSDGTVVNNGGRITDSQHHSAIFSEFASMNSTRLGSKVHYKDVTDINALHFGVCLDLKIYTIILKGYLASQVFDVIKSNTSYCHAMMVMPLLLMILRGWSSYFLRAWLKMNNASNL